MFITHDLATARLLCDRVAVMYLGKVVEMGPAADVLRRPRHPYTRALLEAVPSPDPSARHRPRDLPPGEVPDATDPPSGCRFHPRCPAAFAPCAEIEPPLIGGVACHLYGNATDMDNETSRDKNLIEKMADKARGTGVGTEDPNIIGDAGPTDVPPGKDPDTNWLTPETPPEAGTTTDS